MNNSAPVFIVDDDHAVRDSLGMLLESENYHVITCSSAQEFLDICTDSCVGCRFNKSAEDVIEGASNQCEGCIILDLDIPDMNGLELQKKLTDRTSYLPIIFLTGKGTIPSSVDALKSGALDFLTKPVKSEILLSRVSEALALSKVLKKQAELELKRQEQLSSLTERECEVMKLVAQGDSSKEIAQRLGISHRTVEIHRGRIMHKTGAKSIVDLARFLTLLDTGEL